jgi:LL-diaminopimelate aminotransferase
MKLPERIKGVPPYLYAEMDKVIREVKRAGKAIINIAHGDPDLPAPEPVLEELRHALGEKGAQLYPPYWGIPPLREKIAQWMKARFGITLNPEKEIMVLIGAKEGITHLYFALCDKGDYAMIPNPSYPTYNTSVIFAQGVPVVMPLLEGNNFLPDFKTFTEDVLKKTKLMILNYPNKRPTFHFLRKSSNSVENGESMWFTILHIRRSTVPRNRHQY